MKIILPTAKSIFNLLPKSVINLMRLEVVFDIKETMLIQEKRNQYHQNSLTEDIQRIQNKYYLERRTFM